MIKTTYYAKSQYLEPPEFQQVHFPGTAASRHLPKVDEASGIFLGLFWPQR